MPKMFLTVLMTMLFLASNFSISFAYEHEIGLLSTSMADNIAKAGKKRIAVVDFTDLQGNITELGRFLAEELSVDLTNTAKGFEVIDRNHLNRILAEHKLSLSGIVDQKTVQKLGQIAGVDALITGSITPLERSVRVVCKVIATDTARVISAAKGDIPKTKAIEELFGKGIETGVMSAPQTKTGKNKLQSLPKVEVYDFIFEVDGCKLVLSGKTVRCDVIIINRGSDRNIHLSAKDFNPSSRMIDESGNVYLANEVLLGNKETSFHGPFKLVSGIPTRVILTFDEVFSPLNRISLLEIIAAFGPPTQSLYLSRKEFTVQLRNFPLSR